MKEQEILLEFCKNNQLSEIDSLIGEYPSLDLLYDDGAYFKVAVCNNNYELFKFLIDIYIRLINGVPQSPEYNYAKHHLKNVVSKLLDSYDVSSKIINVANDLFDNSDDSNNSNIDLSDEVSTDSGIYYQELLLSNDYVYKSCNHIYSNICDKINLLKSDFTEEINKINLPRVLNLKGLIALKQIQDFITSFLDSSVRHNNSKIDIDLLNNISKEICYFLEEKNITQYENCINDIRNLYNKFIELAEFLYSKKLDGSVTGEVDPTSKLKPLTTNGVYDYNIMEINLKSFVCEIKEEVKEKFSLEYIRENALIKISSVKEIDEKHNINHKSECNPIDSLKDKKNIEGYNVIYNYITKKFRDNDIDKFFNSEFKPHNICETILTNKITLVSIKRLMNMRDLMNSSEQKSESSYMIREFQKDVECFLDKNILSFYYAYDEIEKEIKSFKNDLSSNLVERHTTIKISDLFLNTKYGHPKWLGMQLRDIIGILEEIKDNILMNGFCSKQDIEELIDKVFSYREVIVNLLSNDNDTSLTSHNLLHNIDTFNHYYSSYKSLCIKHLKLKKELKSDQEIHGILCKDKFNKIIATSLPAKLSLKALGLISVIQSILEKIKNEEMHDFEIKKYYDFSEEIYNFLYDENVKSYEFSYVELGFLLREYKKDLNISYKKYSAFFFSDISDIKKLKLNTKWESPKNLMTQLAHLRKVVPNLMYNHNNRDLLWIKTRQEQIIDKVNYLMSIVRNVDNIFNDVQPELTIISFPKLELKNEEIFLKYHLKYSKLFEYYLRLKDSTKYLYNIKFYQVNLYSDLQLDNRLSIYAINQLKDIQDKLCSILKQLGTNELKFSDINGKISEILLKDFNLYLNNFLNEKDIEDYYQAKVYLISSLHTISNIDMFDIYDNSIRIDDLDKMDSNVLYNFIEEKQNQLIALEEAEGICSIDKNKIKSILPFMSNFADCLQNAMKYNVNLISDRSESLEQYNDSYRKLFEDFSNLKLNIRNSGKILSHAMNQLLDINLKDKLDFYDIAVLNKLKSKLTNDIYNEAYSINSILAMFDFRNFKLDLDSIIYKLDIFRDLPDNFDNKFISKIRDIYYNIFIEIKPNEESFLSKLQKIHSIVTESYNSKDDLANTMDVRSLTDKIYDQKEISSTKTFYISMIYEVNELVEEFISCHDGHIRDRFMNEKDQCFKYFESIVLGENLNYNTGEEMMDID